MDRRRQGGLDKMLDTELLIVEDEDAIRQQLVRRMKRTVRRVDSAEDGQRACEMFREYHYPLVLLDLRLPKVNGMEVFGTIKEHSPESEVVILSAHGRKQDLIAAIKLHAFDYMEKPPKMPELIDAIERAYHRYISNTRAARNDHSNEDEIGQLYAQVRELNQQRIYAPDDEHLSQVYQRAFQQLRHLQEKEAEKAEEAFQRSLSLPRGQGYQTMKAAAEELGHDKSSTESD